VAPLVDARARDRRRRGRTAPVAHAAPRARRIRRGRPTQAGPSVLAEVAYFSHGVAHDDDIRELVTVEQTSFDDAVRLALEED